MTSRSRVLAGVAVACAVGSLPAQSQLLDEAIVRVAAIQGPNVEQGTGFVMSADGLIATAYHVIHGASRIDVYAAGGPPITDVTVVGFRPDADVALLRIPAGRSTRFYRVPLTPPGGVPGEALFVHGHPLGFPRQVLTGARTQTGYLRSQLWLDDDSKPIFAVTNLNLLPLDVTAEPGLSGSPVVDTAGEVLGVLSGSLQRGRGYSWAVPVEYLRLASMQQVGQRASAVRWPTSAGFLRPGLRLARGRTGSGNELWQKCRRQVDTFSDAWNKYYSSQVKLGVPLGLAEPTVASTRKQLTRANAPQMRARAVSLWEYLEPDMSTVATEFQAVQSSLGDMVATCMGEAVLRSVTDSRPPATYENVVADVRFGRRATQIAERIKRNAAEQRAREDALASQFERLFDARAKINQPGADDYQLTVGLLDLIDVIIKTRAGADEATHAANMIGAGLSMSELLQHLSLHEWETAHRTHSYSTAGIKVTLTEGWLPFDERLRAATLAPGQSLPATVQIIDFGFIDANKFPHGFADFSTIPNAAGPASTPPSPQQSGQWRLLENAVADALRREGLILPTFERSQTTLGGDLVLEGHGVGRLTTGREIGIYVALRFRGARAVRLNCVLLQPPWNEYRACTRLIDGVIF